MEGITIKLIERPTYRELARQVDYLDGCLDEAERGKGKAERLAWMCLLLFAVTATLLVLTWSGVIVI